jgi:hypothetical protein
MFECGQLSSVPLASLYSLPLAGTKKRLIIGLVGLPARGKTYLSQKLCRYLNWFVQQQTLSRCNVGETSHQCRMKGG